MATNHEGLVEMFLEAISDSVEEVKGISATQFELLRLIVELLRLIEGRLATVTPVTAYDEEYERWWEK